MVIPTVHFSWVNATLFEGCSINSISDMIWIKKQQAKGGKWRLFNICSSRANSLLFLPIFRSIVTFCWQVRCWASCTRSCAAPGHRGSKLETPETPRQVLEQGLVLLRGNELMFMSQDMPGPTCQLKLTRDELEVTNSRKSTSNTVLGNVSSPVRQIRNKAMKINGPKEQGHYRAFLILPMCSICRAGPCAVSSTQLLSCASPRGSVPGHAVSHCHSSAFIVLSVFLPLI